MGLTTDPEHPDLTKGVDEEPTGMASTYLVMSEEERAKAQRNPVRTKYKHLTCNGVTQMGTALAETYAANPSFYGATYCVHCKMHRPVGANGEFVWDGTDIKVGT